MRNQARAQRYLHRLRARRHRHHRQGPDTDTQYRSAVFASDAEITRWVFVAFAGTIPIMTGIMYFLINAMIRG